VTMKLTAGETVNVPANAPHSFRNLAESPARLLCLCAPAGQDEFFTLVGQAVATRTEAPPPLDDAKQAAFIAKAAALAPHFGSVCADNTNRPGSHVDEHGGDDGHSSPIGEPALRPIQSPGKPIPSNRPPCVTARLVPF